MTLIMRKTRYRTVRGLRSLKGKQAVLRYYCWTLIAGSQHCLYWPITQWPYRWTVTARSMNEEMVNIQRQNYGFISHWWELKYSLPSVSCFTVTSSPLHFWRFSLRLLAIPVWRECDMENDKNQTQTCVACLNSVSQRSTHNCKITGV